MDDPGSPSSRILIVDDNATNLRLLLEVLEAHDHTVLVATNGPKALRIAADSPPDVILLDVMMPEMDGYEVCHRLKADAATAGVPVIFITANDQPESVVAGFRAGAVDYIPKPFRQEEVLSRVQVHLDVHQLTRELEVKNQALEQTNRDLQVAHEELDRAQKKHIENLERELQTAHELQMGLMPTEPPQVEGLQVACRCVPATHVGGDFYQYYHQADKLSIAMADVTGHAMEAAIPAVMFDGILDSQILVGDQLEDLFARLNDRLMARRVSRTHVCFSMMQIEVATRRLRLANAGCPFPFHYRAAAERVEELQVVGYPLGVKADTDYQALEVQLEPADRLVLCSDGIMEARDGSNEVYGYDRTMDTVLQGCSQGLPPEQLLEHVLQTAQAFCGEADQEDDQTIVVVEVGA